MSEEIRIPTLTLATDTTPVAPAIVQVEPVKMEAQEFSDQENKVINDFAKQIDVANANMVLLYGAGAQKNIADFADTALAGVRNRDVGEVGGMLSGLVVELRNFNVFSETEDKGIFGWLNNARRKVTALKTQYDKVEASVEHISDVLEGHQIQLLKDVATLDRLYDMNKQYFKELSMYIAAGERRLEETRTTHLPQLMERARQTGDTMDAQAANDLANMCDRFEKKLHDLKLTRQVSIQMAPQIRLIQNNDSLLVEKIQSSLVNTIPLWKSQMVIALGQAHASQAMKAQRDVTDMTNELLRKNADMLKQGTIETARESERGIVDIETLKHTNQSLIETLDEVVRIQNEGRDKRRTAESELAGLEKQLKDKLLELRG